MKRYYIVKDGEIVALDTTKKKTLAKIHELQAMETHFQLKANFELLTQDSAVTPPETSVHPLCWHIIDEGKIVGAVCHRNQVENMSEVRAIFGKSESIKYRNRN